MKYLSVCSGIEAATVAWHHMGWEAVGYSEIEKFPSQVLAHHYPNVPNLGDMTKFKEWDIGTIDLLVGGTPCQSFSVAGLRKGLEDPRGNLALTYCAILDRFKPKWFVWENVPGVLSSGGGRDFGSFLGAVVQLGYGFAYRVLDAQYFGVAQRRKRVFVVGCLGNWRSAAEVLFERESLCGDIKASRKAIQEVASTITQCFDRQSSGEYGTAPVASTMSARDYKSASDLILQPIPIHDQATRHAGKRGDKQDGKGNGFGIGIPGSSAFTLTKSDRHAVAQVVHGTQDPCVSDFAFTQGRNNGGENVLFQSMAVRRLTPVECERLQGFPDNYTDIKFKAKDTPDGPRYKALGNSMAVPVMRWIGERINNS